MEVAINYKPRDLAAIEADAQQAIATAEFYVFQARKYHIDLTHARALEIGPGHHFAIPLLLAGFGATVSVADRFLPEYDDVYHPKLYRRVAELWKTGPTETLLRATEKPHENYVKVIDQSAEMLSVTEKFDIVYSNATMEHVYDFAAVCRAVARVTRTGGINSHQIDFRDHDHFDRPLEFLCIPDDEHLNIFDKRVGETGNRIRPIEAEQLFRGAGFDMVIPPYPTERATDEYLADFMPRLRASNSRFASWPADELKVVSALYVLRRNDSPSL